MKFGTSHVKITIYYRNVYQRLIKIIFRNQIDTNTEPFKMEYKQNEYSFSRCSSAFFLGIVFVLVPVSLSADLVYDREVIKLINNLY